MNLEMSPEMQEALEKASHTVVTVEELKNPQSTSKDIKVYVEGLIQTLEEENPEVKIILEARPGSGVDRRQALIETMMKTMEVKVDALQKGQYKSDQEFTDGVRKQMGRIIETFGKNIA